MMDLQSKAKEMVMLAEKMRLKLLSGSNSQTNTTNDEEMGSKEEIQELLLSVGIISPVTKESAGALYHQQLSRQVLLSLLSLRLFLSNLKNSQLRLFYDGSFNFCHFEFGARGFSCLMLLIKKVV